MNRRQFLTTAGGALAIVGRAPGSGLRAAERKATDLVGYWPLRGDCQDRSSYGNHGRSHGDGAAQGEFDGHASFVEIPPSSSLQFGRGDFTLCAWVWTARETDDVVGDVVAKFDPVQRKGFNLTLKSSSGGYNSHGDDCHVLFGIDDARTSDWEDCGRPSPTSNYVSNSLTVFDGHLYAAITDAVKEEDWCHVFRYHGKSEWQDCGRVGNLKTRGVGPMIVHQGHLYAATWNYDWTRVGIDRPGRPRYEADYCRVYRYAGGKEWIDCGQPGNNRRLFGMAIFHGALYVVGEDRGCYVREGGAEWKRCGSFPNYAHPMAVHHGRLFAGVLNPAGVHAYDGQRWKALGNPYGSEKVCNQIHALEIYGGRLYATTWPEGRVARLEKDDQWVDCGRLGDCIEINGLTVYNGKLYGGTIPRAEVFRYDGDKSWTSIHRFLDPAGYEFKDSTEWARVTSLTVYGGKLFASMGSCTSSHLDAPADFRGKVYAFEAGKCISYDRDLGPGWKHLAAVKRARRLELFVDGQGVAESSVFNPRSFDLHNHQPLRIGFGETDYFSGKIREVRVYNRALTAVEIQRLARSAAR